MTMGASRTAVFRVDASPAVGFGHLMRCLTLADAWAAAGGACVFATRPMPPAAAARLSRAGHAHLLLPDDLPPPDEPAFLRAALANPAEWLVTDHYGIGAEWQERARDVAARILAIDDLADRPLACDLLLNPNLAADREAYAPLLAPDTRCLLGLEYALLQPEFRDRRRARPRAHSGTVDRLLISLGGADEHDVTGRVLDAIALLNATPIAVDVVLGGAYARAAALEARAAALPQDVRLHRDVPTLADLTAAADLGIGAGGTSCWERCCLGLPTLIVEIARNQHANATSLDAAGAAVNLGWYADLEPGTIAGAIDRLRGDPARVRAMADAAAGLVDGRGAERVVAAMRETP